MLVAGVVAVANGKDEENDSGKPAFADVLASAIDIKATIEPAVKPIKGNGVLLALIDVFFMIGRISCIKCAVWRLGLGFDFLLFDFKAIVPFRYKFNFKRVILNHP